METFVKKRSVLAWLAALAAADGAVGLGADWPQCNARLYHAPNGEGVIYCFEPAQETK
jgi:hypothetical protein